MEELYQKQLDKLDEAELFAYGEEDIIYFAKQILGLDLNPFQERVCLLINQWWREYKGGNPEMLNFILDTGNRVGKTTLLAIIHLWFLYYKKGIDRSDFKYWRHREYNTFNLSPVSRQAKNLIDYVEAIITSKFAWEVDRKMYVNKCRISDFIIQAKGGELSINHQLGEIRFKGNCTMICVSTGQDKGASVQGSACGLMTYDECVQSHHLRDEVEGPRLRSRLGDYGIAFGLISTPDEQAPSQQHYFHLVREAERAIKRNEKPDYHIVYGRYEENIFIPEKQRKIQTKEAEKKPGMAKQMLEGGFVSTGVKMFPVSVIDQLWNGKKMPTAPTEGRLYVVGADWAVADKGDETIMYVVDYTNLELFSKPSEIVKEVAVKGGDPWNLMATYKLLCQEYATHSNANDSYAENIMDTGAMGGVMFKKMLKELHPHPFEGGEAKKDALTALNLMLTFRRKYRIIEATGASVEDNPDFGLLRSYELPGLEDELSSYKLEDDKIKQDRVMALAMIAGWLWKKYKNRLQGKTEHRSYHINPFKQTNYLIR